MSERLTVQQTCDRYQIGRSTFYRYLGDPESGLEGVVLRVGPRGRIRVPVEAFEAWLSSCQRARATRKGRRRPASC